MTSPPYSTLRAPCCKRTLAGTPPRKTAACSTNPRTPEAFTILGLGVIADDIYPTLKRWPVGERNEFCTKLWDTQYLEDGALAGCIYRRFMKVCGEPEFRLFEFWIDSYAYHYSHVDELAPHAIAGCLAHHPPLLAELDAWTQSANRWKRRAAAGSLTQEAWYDRNLPVIFRIAKPLLLDADRFVRMSAGDLLAAAYKKHPEEILAFLQAHPRIPSDALSSATHKMPAAIRRRLLA